MDPAHWTDAGTSKLQRADLDGTRAESLVTTGLINPVGIALDVAAGKMVWTDHGSDKIQRAVLDIPDGQNHATRTDFDDLVTAQLGNPLGITLDLTGQWMYWTDHGLGPARIQRARLDGIRIENVVAARLNVPFGLVYIPEPAGPMTWILLVSLATLQQRRSRPAGYVPSA